jgi:hypothetical protein
MAHPRDPEDIDSGTKNDHAIDSFRYGMMWREYPVKCPEVSSESSSSGKYVPRWMNKGKNSEWV